MKKLPKTIFRISLYTLAGVVLLIAAIQLSFTFHFNSKIKSELEQQVFEQSDGEYNLKIEKLRTNIFNQSVFISGFQLSPPKNAETTDAKYFASASEINLINCSLLSFLIRKNLTVSKIELVNPSGYLYRAGIKKKTVAKKRKNKFSLYSLLGKNIHELKIIRIKVSNAHLSVYDDIKDSIPSLSSVDNELEIKNLQISKAVEESGRLFYADKMHLVMNRFTYTTRDSLYSFKVKQLSASYTDAALTIDSIEVIPNFSKKQFSNEAGKQTDRMNVSIAGLQFINMNVKLFFERNWFVAKQLKVHGLNLTAYRNKNIERIYLRKKSVQELLREIPVYTAIDKVEIKNALVVYEETAEGATTAGRISFNKLNATVTGVTNDTTLFARYKNLEVYVAGLFMNAGKLKGHYKFPLNTVETVFDCSGQLLDMPIDAINPILEPNANISIRSGHIDSLTFSFHANETASKGKLYFYYHGLKMEFLSKKSHKSGTFQDVLSFLAHSILLKEDNPAPNKSVRISDISYKRNPDRFIFNYTWKSILSGIKPVIGIPGGKK